MNRSKDPPGNPSDVELFGKQVREKRKARGWSLEALAAEAFSNSTRKGYVSQIENGKIPNITRENVRSVVRALEMSLDEVPPSLRWQGAVNETNPNSAYLRALGLLSSATREFSDFTSMYLSVEDTNELFHEKRVVEHFRSMILNTFFWKRERDGKLQIYGKSHSKESEPFLICNFEVPEPWIGCGGVSIYYLWEHNDGPGEDDSSRSKQHDLLLVIYLFSPEPRDFPIVFKDEDEDAPQAFLAALRLNPAQVRQFYRDARENFEDIE